LELRYRAPLWAYVFYIAWYFLLTLFAAALIGNGWASERTSSDEAMIVSTIGLLLLAPIALHSFGTRRSEDELTDILDFVSQHVEATG